VSDKPTKAYRVEERWGMTKIFLVHADTIEDAKRRVCGVDPDNVEGIDTAEVAPLGFRSVRRCHEEDRQPETTREEP
jgi:hypothetical protein